MIWQLILVWCLEDWNWNLLHIRTSIRTSLHLALCLSYPSSFTVALTVYSLLGFVTMIIIINYAWCWLEKRFWESTYKYKSHFVMLVVSSETWYTEYTECNNYYQPFYTQCQLSVQQQRLPCFLSFSPLVACQSQQPEMTLQYIIGSCDLCGSYSTRAEQGFYAIQYIDTLSRYTVQSRTSENICCWIFKKLKVINWKY